MAQARLQWEAPEYIFKKKNSDWFWAVWIVALAFVVMLLVFGNVLLALLVAVGVIVLSLYALRRPHTHHIEIRERGIVIDTELFPYTSLDSFWIDELERPPRLLVQTNRTLAPLLVILLDPELDTDTVRDVMLDYLDEAELSEPLTQKLMERFGF